VSQAARIATPPAAAGTRDRAPARVRCAHCGLRVPRALLRAESDGGPDEKQFCCDGCRQVHALLHDWGYQEYYRLKAATDTAEPVPASISGRTFEDFDDPAFADEHVEAVGDGFLRTRLYLEGVHCAACVWLVEHLPRRMAGLREVRLDFARAQATVEWDPAATRLSTVARALDGVGYTPHPYRPDALRAARRTEDRALLLKLGVAAAAAMNIMFIQATLYAGDATGMDAGFSQFFRWLSFLLATPVLLWSARPFYLAAWAGLRQRVPHIDLPISIALVVAYAASAIATIRGTGEIWFDSLAMLVALLLGARYIQTRAQRAAVDRTEGLRSAAFVEFARRIEVAADGVERAREVPAAALARGDRVEVRSGEGIPADGRVIEGRSTVDNAVLTGESTPMEVAPGDAVSAGATNLGARLVVEVDAAGAASRVGALLGLVEQALARKAPIVRLADSLGRRFVLVVLALAAATGALWLALDPPAALERVVALLVITCPCALGLATPVAMTVALSRAARRGVFVKDADVLERLRGVRTVLLDKTGTLTRGEARVTATVGDPAALALAAALEAHSTHPVAHALRAAALAAAPAGAPVPAVTDVRETAGRGISGRVGAHVVAVGNAAHVTAAGASPDEGWQARAATIAAAGASPTFVAVDGAVRAVFGVGDPLRDDAAATVAALRARGWHVRILSGDHPAVVRAVAAQVGVPAEDALGGLTPEEKRDLVLEGGGARHPDSPADPAFRLAAARRGRAGVLMLGDGVNDAAALAAADVGVSVHGGTAASIVAADVVLTRGGLTPVVELAEGARRALRVIHRNLGISLAYNLTGAALAISGLVGPLLAAVLMPTSSLTVILSSVLGRPFAPRPAAQSG
jgi:Cu2+-exporting ATPase